jgi:hypothetical protein
MVMEVCIQVMESTSSSQNCGKTFKNTKARKKKYNKSITEPGLNRKSAFIQKVSLIMSIQSEN